MRNVLICLVTLIIQLNRVRSFNIESTFKRFCQKRFVESLCIDQIGVIFLFVSLIRSRNGFVSEKLAHVEVKDYVYLTNWNNGTFIVKP
jgi:hypothetical protein